MIATCPSSGTASSGMSISILIWSVFSIFCTAYWNAINKIRTRFGLSVTFSLALNVTKQLAVVETGHGWAIFKGVQTVDE
jgi:hypothetical protein